MDLAKGFNPYSLLTPWEIWDACFARAREPVSVIVDIGWSSENVDDIRSHSDFDDSFAKALVAFECIAMRFRDFGLSAVAKQLRAIIATIDCEWPKTTTHGTEEHADRLKLQLLVEQLLKFVTLLIRLIPRLRLVPSHCIAFVQAVRQFFLHHGVGRPPKIAQALNMGLMHCFGRACPLFA